MSDARLGAAPPVVIRVTSLAVIALLLGYWFLQPFTVTFKLVTAVLVIASVIRPMYGLMAFAALAPLSTVVASLCGAKGLGAELLEQMALAIGAGVIVTTDGQDEGTRIGAPGLLMAVVAIASAAATIPAAAAPISYGRLLRDLAFIPSAQSSVWSPLFVALTVAECALLGWATERVVRRSPQLAPTLVLVALMGHAVSASLSVEAVVRAAMRESNVLDALRRLLMSVRLSYQTDWNAAASAFLLAGVAGFGLTRATGLRRLFVMLLLALVGAGLWITGSRVAIVLAVLATIGTLGWLVIRKSRYQLALVGGVVVLIVAVGAWLAVGYPEGRNDQPGNTLRERLVLMKAGMKMWESAPSFGIGIDGFYEASTRFADASPPGIPTVVPENAHNNFVQVLAEQGLAGLLALLWWLSIVIVAGARAQLRQPTAARGALLLGIVACVATWLTGHPLLVPEFAFVFWFYAATLTAMTPAPGHGRPRWLLWILAAGIVLSVPIRASALRDSTNLEYRGLGVSLWQHDDTQRYRNAGSTFALFLQATGRPIDVPLRRAPGAPDSLVVNIRIDDKLVNRIVIAGDAWQVVQVTVPQGPRQFALVDFSVEAPSTTGGSLPEAVLRVGRETAR